VANSGWNGIENKTNSTRYIARVVPGLGKALITQKNAEAEENLNIEPGVL
jgi:hypothetical protein